jgi:hypothetical protein
LLEAGDEAPSALPENETQIKFRKADISLFRKLMDKAPYSESVENS